MPHPAVEVRPSGGRHNALWHFRKDVSLWRVTWNFFWIMLARWTPFFRVKNLFYRMTGAKIGKHVAIGFEATLDILFPQRITVEDDVVIGYSTTILCHGYMRDAAHHGPVRIGAGAAIGAQCLILPGVTVGEGAVVGAMSLVNRDIPPGEFWAGVPARRVRKAY